MKKYLLVTSILITICSIQLEGQVRFVEDGKVWHMRCEVSAMSGGIFEDYDFNYFIQGDTVINEMQCKKFYSFNKENDGKTTYIMSLYEADNKVFFIAKGSSKQYVLYDFGCETGQLFDIAAVINSNPSIVTMKVEKECKVNMHGTDRNCYKVMRVNGGDETESWSPGWWIEGVGSELGPLHTWGFNLPGNISYLIDCEVNGETILDASDLSSLKSEESTDPKYDLNGDGLVDVDDVNALIKYILSK